MVIEKCVSPLLIRWVSGEIVGFILRKIHAANSVSSFEDNEHCYAFINAKKVQINKQYKSDSRTSRSNIESILRNGVTVKFTAMSPSNK